MIVPLLKENGKYSLFDTHKKKVLFNTEYDKIDFFKEGFAVAYLKDKWFYVARDGRTLKLQYDYQEITPFEDGIAAVKRDGLWRFINRNGIEITKKGYYSYNRLDDNLIEVFNVIWGINMELYNEGEVEGAQSIAEYNNGIIDYMGFEIVTPECSINLYPQQDGFILSSSKGAYEAIDYNGEPLFMTQDFDYISSFSDGRAIAIRNGDNDVLIVDKQLETVCKIGNSKLGKFDHGHEIIDNLVLIKHDNKWGFVDTDGKIVCECQYDYLRDFSEGFAVAGIKNGESIKFAVLNRNFVEVVSAKYDIINDFSDGLATVKLNNMWGAIDCSGNEIVPIIFNNIGTYCMNGFISVSYGDLKNKDYFGKYGFYSIEGVKVCPIVYDWVNNFELDAAIIKLDGKYGILGRDGTEKSSIIYDEISPACDNYFWVERDDRKFVIDLNGTEFIEQYIIRDDLFK